MRDRGQAIKSESWKDVKKIESKLTNRIQNDQAFLDKLQRPCSVFVSMEWEQGKDRADFYEETVEIDRDLRKPDNDFRQFLGDNITVKPASEPSDIIWENRNILNVTRNFRKCCTGIILAFVLAGSFAVIYYAQMKQFEIAERYPAQVCETHEMEYKDRLSDWQYYAIGEYISNQDIAKQPGGMPIYNGPMQCFCKHQKDAGVSDDTVYTLKNERGTMNISEKICKRYEEDLALGLYITLGVTGVVVLVNMLLEMVTFYLVTWIGIDTISAERTFTVKCLVFA